ncbi:hypothetical protein HYFRA_00000293 [Hymenoscyphus fraxineus]|uniref:SacI domain protein n=1 Tax=Hymenoscyphus fraxineus TaxID=746836 RepID=A0A9N9PSF1_9HELO|nr:hypothetical protein HYFRA_00000293 [Hymenoscyphus fraxineus]
MPGIVRKILIFAALDGLVLQPLSHKGQRPAPATKIAYNEANIGPALKQREGEDEGRCFEAFGIVGLLTVSKTSFLISITRRQQVAQIQGKPIYVITEVAVTPLASRAEASASIEQTKTALQKGAVDGHELDEPDSEDEDDGARGGSDDVDDQEAQPVVMNSSSNGHKKTSSVAEDVISKKGGYGRFAKEWFSKKGWTADQRRNLGMTASEDQNAVLKTGESGAATPTGSDAGDQIDKNDVLDESGKKAKEVAGALVPKLLRTAQLYFGSSRSFYFSYDYDLTRSFLNRGEPANTELHLHETADPLFFWNRHIVQPFVDAGQGPLVLPLLQGYVGQREFQMDTDPPQPILVLDGAEKCSMEMRDLSPRMSQEGRIPDVDGAFGNLRYRSKSPIRRDTMKSFSLTLISRRSVKRAGLRYLRRGVDEDGHTANSVETEQILADSEWNPTSKVHSFVQLRGSIPIFFSQTPYSFKPVPQIQHSVETNYKAFNKHFDNISARYGRVQVASLVEKHGPEAIVGEQFEKFATRLNESGGIRESKVEFEWFDFHSACRGMKFENVSLLMDSLGDQLDEFGFTVEANGVQTSKQSGVLRTNCMDCLDRTNVVQNYIGKRALEQQLKDEGIDFSLQADQTNQWFNMLWADNGDAVSKQYASTAAMKGDFTRTRKRDYKGAITDMGLSISRFYSGIVNDFFSQAAIDFFLGNMSSLVFDDFESNLMSRDPAVSMQRMRQQAIEACQKLVIADEDEEMIGGWTLLTPNVPNTIKSSPFEESILLLTDSGLYSCRFDWNMEKVSSFERVSLDHIVGIKYGTYITSTLTASQADEARNVGFVITYKVGMNDITRINTRSMANVARPEVDFLGLNSASVPAPLATGIAALIGRPQSPADRVLALKALYTRSAVSKDADAAQGNAMSELEQVTGICEEIERMIRAGRVVEVGNEREREGLVERGEIISLAEARKSTGLLEQLGHSFKKLIWA